MAHTWGRGLHNTCRLRGPNRLTAEGTIRSGPRVGHGAIKPLLRGGVPTASRQGGESQRWPTIGPGGHITPVAGGVPTALERGAKSEVANKWDGWLHNACRLWGPQCFGAGGQNEEWRTSGPHCNITVAAWGVPTASRRGAKAKVANNWAGALHNPSLLGGLHR